MDEQNSCPIPHPELISRSVDDELVVVRPADGQIRVLNGVGALIWQSMDGQQSIADLTSLVCADYEVSPTEAESDIRSFLDPLLKSGLVIWTEGDAK